jgi:hypothetical protein
MVVRGAGGTHRRAEGRRRRPQEELLELPLQVLQALPLALLLRVDQMCARVSSWWWILT